MTLARRKILIAGMGTSPAVLTNAVWALAHREKLAVTTRSRQRKCWCGGNGII